MSFAADLREKASTLWHIQRVKILVREHMRLGPNALVTVAEVVCSDPECPGPATQITILGVDLIRRTLLVHRSVAEVTAGDLNVTGAIIL